ncbi:MAG: RluA family pseudouridine synthase [Magnetospirillum sp. WYHS-4]
MTDDSTPTYTVAVPDDKAGWRLDKLLADALPELSRTRLKALILDGRVTFGGCSCGQGVALRDPDYRVQEAQSFRIRVPAPTPAGLPAQAMDLAIVYEDDELIVLDKPAGLVVHPAPGNPDQTLVNALLAHCGESLKGIGGVERPGIVHRLDKDTSGLMVVAKTEQAHRGLAAQFAVHSLERVYHAVVWGVPSPRQGEIAGNIGRSPRNRKKMAVVAKGGKPALTRYRVLRTFGDTASLVECRLATGRTHQIRVHMASLGHPVIGDPLYGGNSRQKLKALLPETGRIVADFKRQALHALVIGFEHPKTQKVLRFESILPRDIIMLIGVLEVL